MKQSTVNIGPNTSLCCSDCTRKLHKWRKELNSIFSKEELEEGYCYYFLYCKSNKLFEEKFGKNIRIGGYAKLRHRQKRRERWYSSDIEKRVRINVVLPCSQTERHSFIHEMQHAVDNCSQEFADYTLDDYMCMEMRAYSKANVPKGKDEAVYKKNLFDSVKKSYNEVLKQKNLSYDEKVAYAKFLDLYNDKCLKTYIS